jgi:DNA-directed RNA polymerase subunit M/transcription elongation factor TFIIS
LNIYEDTMIYRRNPDTGKVYAFGGLIGARTLDDQRSEREDFDKMLERRADITAPRRRFSARAILDAEYRLGGVLSARGTVACPECENDNRPDSEFCSQCGNALIPLEPYDGAQSSDTLRCEYCSRMNDPANLFCTGCGRNLSTAKAEKNSRWRARARTPARSAVATRFSRSPSPSPRPRRGSDRPGMLIALESYDFIEPSTKQRVHIKAVTFADPKCSAVKARPLAWAA